MKNLPYVLIILAAINSAFGNIFIKKSQLNSEFAASILSLNFILGLVFYGINLLLFAFSLKYIQVSRAYPLLAGLSFIFLIVLSNRLLSEQLQTVNYLGIFVILLGIILLVK
jgi:multidrug transporter EmrE-like cation transporter